MFNNISTDNDTPHNVGELKGEMNENVKYIKKFRMEIPIHLTPETATLEDIKIHAITQQYLNPNTVQKRITYLKFMENHVIPINLRKPDKNNFLMHIRYRLFYEQPPAGVFAIRHEWEAMRMLLRSYGIRPWDIRLPPCPKHRKRNIPLPDIAHEFWHYKYYKNRYKRKLFQYMYFTGFLLGMRPPAEIANLHTYDIQFLRNKKAILTITEDKKHKSQRQIPLSFQLASDPLHKSLKNWIDSWRSKVENRSSDDYLFIQHNGRPFTNKYLGRLLSENGKKVWKHYQPYCMRHWNAIAKLIQTKIKTGSYQPYTVKNWMGHETIKTTEEYIKYAEQYYELAPYSWIQRVLRHPVMEGVKHVERKETDRKAKNSSVGNSNRRNSVWARRRPYCLTDRIKLTDSLRSHLSVFHSNIISKNFLFSLYNIFEAFFIDWEKKLKGCYFAVSSLPHVKSFILMVMYFFCSWNSTFLHRNSFQTSLFNDLFQYFSVYHYNNYQGVNN